VFIRFYCVWRSLNLRKPGRNTDVPREERVQFLQEVLKYSDLYRDPFVSTISKSSWRRKIPRYYTSGLHSCDCVQVYIIGLTSLNKSFTGPKMDSVINLSIDFSRELL